MGHMLLDYTKAREPGILAIGGSHTPAPDSKNIAELKANRNIRACLKHNAEP